MVNTTLTADVIAKTAIAILENETIMAKKVYRGYEEEFHNKVNGYDVGETISVRRPTDFTVRKTITMNTQSVKEGKFPLTVDQIRGVDFEFTSQDLTLNITKIAERVIRPAMVQLANEIDVSLMELYADIPSWVGTPGEKIDGFGDLGQGGERMDEYSNPRGARCAVLSPKDHWALLSSQTALFTPSLVEKAYSKAHLGHVGGVDIYMDQNVPIHVVGSHGGTPLVNGAAQNVTYDASMNTNQQPLITDGWDASVNGLLKVGDVFTIAGVYAVNAVSKKQLEFLRQFTVVADANSDGAGNATLTVTPAIIDSGAFQTVSSAPADNAVITVMGAPDAAYRQNLMFCEEAFAFVSVPLVMPPGSVGGARQSYKGVNVRVIPVYDGINDVSKWRMDVLFGRKTVDARKAHRLSGTA